jgi:hypothetical protein
MWYKKTVMTQAFATIYKQDLDYISKAILDFPEIETGGDFFGFWNNLGMPVILYVTGPGENCYRHATFFKQDLDFLVGVGNSAYAQYGLQHIGSWHSHHTLGLAVPSYHDCNTMASAINKNKLDKFFMILGNITEDGGTTVNGFLFDKENQTRYTETRWRIISEKNIISESIESQLPKQLIYTPATQKQKLQDLKIINEKQSQVISLDFEPQSWLGSEKGKKELKEIFRWFKGEYQNAKMFITETQTLEIKADNIVIFFEKDFPNSPPFIINDKINLTTETGPFVYTDETDILEFIKIKLQKQVSTKDTFENTKIRKDESTKTTS